jgi:predicted unusual protein kinase regulating ubiquinone biosynthesis (AarF/ABC1/UbiB family)
LVLEDGRVGFIDFGIVGRIPPNIWESVTDLAASLTSGPDFNGMASALIRMGAATGGGGDGDRAATNGRGGATNGGSSSSDGISDVNVAQFAADLKAAAEQLDSTLAASTVTVTASREVWH